MRTPHKHIVAVLTVGNLFGQLLIWAIVGIIGIKLNVWLVLLAVVFASLCAVACWYKKAEIKHPIFGGGSFRSARYSQHYLDHRYEFEHHELPIKPDGD